jgi:DMSO/TMAO reductase YedYZ molybdopterin-dependent catalytic subunit
MGRKERSLGELYAGDPERADAVVFGRRTDMTRRGFVGGAGFAAISAAVGGPIVFGASMPAGLVPAAFAQDVKRLSFPGKDPGLVVLDDKPLAAETPPHLLDDETTPTEKFFIRNNGRIPDAVADPDAWTLTIDGEVAKPLEISLGELKRRTRPRTLHMVLECGGNGRSFFTPRVSGNQWTHGGVGCAEWTGVALGDLLRAAGLRATAVYTANTGTDLPISDDRSRPTLSRGVPIRKAMEQHSLLVWAMNGQPLPTIHGGPLRLIHPGWPGSVSHKWLSRITIRDKVHDGEDMLGTSYRTAIKPMLPGSAADAANFRILESMPVRDPDQPRQRHALPGPHQGARSEGRRLGRRLRRPARRGVDRLRRHVGPRLARPAQEPLRLAALDGERAPAERRLLRDLGARHRLRRPRAAPHRRQLEPARLRRQPHAPHRRAGRLTVARCAKSSEGN